MRKRERLEALLAGERPDRVPVALWRHWPGDDQRAADFVRYTVGFQRAYDWDFIKLMPFSAYGVADYGLTCTWNGHNQGDREIVKRPITRSLDWTDLRALDPARGELGRHLQAVQMLSDALGDDDDDPVPVVATLYSPLTQAFMLGGQAATLRHMRQNPDRLKTGLHAITETMLRQIESLRRTVLAGVFYVADHACLDVVSAAEYDAFGEPYDRKVLDALPERWWFNVLHLGGSAPSFDRVESFGLPVLHWDAPHASPGFVHASSRVGSVLLGGLDSDHDLHFGTPMSIRESAKTAINEVDSRRLILAANNPAPVTTPRSNLRAVRDAVE